MGNSVDLSLLLNAVSGASKTADALLKTESSESVSERTADFADTLSEAINELSQNKTESTGLAEMEELISALDKSILGDAGSTLNARELAVDFASNPEESVNVIKQLAGGHMQSIVTTSDDDEDDSSIFKTTTNLSKSDEQNTTESLSDNLETIMEHLQSVIG